MIVNTSRDLLIALSLLPFLTPNRTRLLREHFASIDDACSAPTALLRELLSLTPEQAAEVRNPQTNERRAYVKILRERVVTIVDDEYPARLKEIADPPLVLHVRGDVSLLARPALAIVGSRRASPYGLNAASQFARQIASTGIVVVSGLALGIDAAAHLATLDAGGKTVAVLGTGIDIVYPRSNARLTQRIENEGLIVSEFPPGTPPKPEQFPIRNRVISGLSLGTVIVEATGKSGSLITARMALEQGRDVFVVPGSIFSPGSEGTHRLAQSGAKLVHDVNDVLEELPGGLHVTKETEPEPEPPHKEVLAVLSRDEAVHADTVAARLRRTPAAVAQSLLELELTGWIRAVPGARYVRLR